MNSSRAQRRRLALHLLLPLCLGSLTAAQKSSCGSGDPYQVRVERASFPADGSSTQQLDWGITTPETLSIPKFDPSLGTLVALDIVLEVRFHGNYIIDNQGGFCSHTDMSGRVLVLTDPGSNNPPLTGLSTLVLDRGVRWTPPGGTLLGSSDGIDDCANPTGPQATGNCAAGEDHLADTFDETFLSSPFNLQSPDLQPWIATAPGQTVSLSSRAFGMFQGGAPTNSCFLIRNYASLSIEVTYRYCLPFVGTRYCDCSLSSPCGNSANPAFGCANSTGLGAELYGTGSNSLMAADLVLNSRQLPINRPGLFFQGNGVEGGGLGIPFGGGLRCVASAIVRLEVITTDSNGHASSSVDLAAASHAAPGEARFYQLWYRDNSGASCGSGFNLTNGFGVTWAP